MRLGADFLDAVKATDLMGMFCLLVIAIMSLRSWMIIIQKWFWLRALERQNYRFEDDYIANGGSLEDAFQSVKHFALSPIAHLLKETFLEYELNSPLLKKVRGDESARAVRLSIERALERTMSDEQDRMEEKLSFLATTANVAPLIGLFGTVWGILGAFQGLAFKGAVAIQTLAPGISTALTTTVVGLIAAIPAAVAFNAYTSRVRRLMTDLEMFSLQLMSVIDKRILQDK